MNPLMHTLVFFLIACTNITAAAHEVRPSIGISYGQYSFVNQDVTYYHNKNAEEQFVAQLGMRGNLVPFEALSYAVNKLGSRMDYSAVHSWSLLFGVNFNTVFKEKFGTTSNTFVSLLVGREFIFKEGLSKSEALAEVQLGERYKLNDFVYFSPSVSARYNFGIRDLNWSLQPISFSFQF